MNCPHIPELKYSEFGTRLKDAIGDLLVARLREHGCGLDDASCRELLSNDVELNAQGLLVWRDRAKG